MPQLEEGAALDLRSGKETDPMDTDAGRLAKEFYAKYESSHRLIVCKGVDHDFLTLEFPATEVLEKSETSGQEDWQQRMSPAPQSREYMVIFLPQGVFQVSHDDDVSNVKTDIEKVSAFQLQEVDSLVDRCLSIRDISFVRGEFRQKEESRQIFDNSSQTLSFKIKMLDLKNSEHDREIVRTARKANEMPKDTIYSDVNVEDL